MKNIPSLLCGQPIPFPFQHIQIIQINYALKLAWKRCGVITWEKKLNRRLEININLQTCALLSAQYTLMMTITTSLCCIASNNNKPLRRVQKKKQLHPLLRPPWPLLPQRFPQEIVLNTRHFGVNALWLIKWCLRDPWGKHAAVLLRG